MHVTTSRLFHVFYLPPVKNIVPYRKDTHFIPLVDECEAGAFYDEKQLVDFKTLLDTGCWPTIFLSDYLSSSSQFFHPFTPQVTQGAHQYTKCDYEAHDAHIVL
jgi:hypothetical protein